jgi:hypothetical protein
LEVLRVVFASEVLGIDQHKLAAMYGTNSGRVAEAVVTQRWAAENQKLLYRYIQRLKAKNKAAKEPKGDELEIEMAEADAHRVEHQPKLTRSVQ